MKMLEYLQSRSRESERGEEGGSGARGKGTGSKLEMRTKRETRNQKANARRKARF